uniref:non-classical arabinogalactan protein 30-like n=1 Tax=Erigeron canadensis TaxID=72917 RepID=UPI001CB8E408|nr:non-classical arabinogalactan protein 30-like [Erigeron canadensis]
MLHSSHHVYHKVQYPLYIKKCDIPQSSSNKQLSFLLPSSFQQINKKKMANNQFTTIILILLPLAFLVAATIAHEVPAKQDKTATVVVEGKVYCQSCKYFGSWSLTDAEPIPAAKVSVICKNHKRRVSYYNAFETDKDGYFYAELKDFKMSHYLLDHPLHSCHVKLVSSPLQTCNLLSNVNNGINGSPLRFENKVVYGNNYEAVVYGSGPLAFRPTNCGPEPTD